MSTTSKTKTATRVERAEDAYGKTFGMTYGDTAGTKLMANLVEARAVELYAASDRDRVRRAFIASRTSRVGGSNCPLMVERPVGPNRAQRRAMAMASTKLW